MSSISAISGNTFNRVSSILKNNDNSHKSPIKSQSFPRDFYKFECRPNMLQCPVDLFSTQSGIPPRLEEAGRKAFEKYKYQPTACERTAIELHSQILGKDYIYARGLPKANLGENGKSLDYLKELTNNGKLKPGMLIFINTVPGMDLNKLSPSNRHWFTYMGKDNKNGEHVFHDQMGEKRSLSEMINTFKYTSNPDVAGLKERKIHTIFDPYGTKRNSLLY